MRAILIAMAVLVTSCQKKSDGVLIRKSDMVEGRQTYTVVLGDTIVEHMYAEEIAQSLIDGQWAYNEDLKVTQ